MHVKRENLNIYLLKQKGKYCSKKEGKESESKEKWVQEERQGIENQTKRRDSASNNRKFLEKKKTVKKKKEDPSQKNKTVFFVRL